MAFVKRYGLTLIGLVVGALLGYWYYAEIGCVSGSCPITGKPVPATVYGSVLFGLLANSLRTNKSNNNKK